MVVATRPLDLVLDRLPGAKENGQGWKARCPAHEDASPSLSIGLGEDGRVLLKCFAGCAPEAIVAAMGLTLADLFPREGRRERRVVAETDYRVRDEHGVVQGIHRRRDYSDGEKDVFWLAPDGRARGLGGRKLETMPLYGCEHLAARPGEPVIVCEGEKAAQALLDAGYLAVGTVTGASSGPNAEVLSVLIGRDVILWPDHDVLGMTHMMRVMRTLGELAIPGRLITWPGAPDKGDAYDALAMRVDVDALIAAAVAPRFAEVPPPPPRAVSRIVLAGDGPIAPPEYLIDGVLPKDALASIVAKEASYKSFIAIGMAAAVHTGTAWAGRDAERAPVLYLAAEGQSGIRRRLRAWQIVHGTSLADLMLLPEPVSFLSGDDVARLAVEIGALPAMPALIVVDTLARNFGAGNENGADDMGRFIAACDRLRALTSACVLIVHHENKLGGYRGSTAFAGAMDTMIEARREGTAVTLACKKQKDDGEFEPIHLAARVVDLGIVDRHDRPVSSIVLQPTDVSFVLRQREQAAGETVLSKNERLALDALNTLPERKASFSDWLRASGLARNSFDRARQALLERGLIRNLGGGYAPSADGHPQVTPAAPPNQSPPVPHPYTVGLGVTAGPPWTDEDTHLPEEIDERHLREEDPDELPF